jgi:hypothetical protein
MITIRITNAREVARKKKGWLVAAVGRLVVDLDDVVEETVVRRIQQQLAAEGIEAVIERVPTPEAETPGPES